MSQFQEQKQHNDDTDQAMSNPALGEENLVTASGGLMAYTQDMPTTMRLRAQGKNSVGAPLRSNALGAPLRSNTRRKLTVAQ
jgi:hypothetical protein